MANVVSRIHERNVKADRTLEGSGLLRNTTSRAQLAGANALDAGVSVVVNPLTVALRGLLVGAVHGILAGIAGVALFAILGGATILATSALAPGIAVCAVLATGMIWAGAKAVSDYNKHILKEPLGGKLADKWARAAGATGPAPAKSPAKSQAATPAKEPAKIQSAAPPATAKATADIGANAPSDKPGTFYQDRELARREAAQASNLEARLG